MKNLAEGTLWRYTWNYDDQTAAIDGLILFAYFYRLFYLMILFTAYFSL